METLLLAIMLVESGGDPNAIGDYNSKTWNKEQIATAVFDSNWPKIKKIDPAIGAYQIHWMYWQDGCRILKVDWPYSDGFNKEKSKKIVDAYLMHYGHNWARKTELPPNSVIPAEILARIHNGGPSGYKKNSTKTYWQKVYKKLKQM